jgi:alpha-L-rhamnosidase
MKRFSYIFLISIELFHFSCSSNSQSNAECTNLRCSDLTNPIGVTARPYFGWHMEDPDDGEVQTAYQLLVASSPDLLSDSGADLWNRGKVNSDKQNYIYYEGGQLISGTRYYWKVKSWDKDGNEGDFSEVATFDVGLLENSDWGGANWIRRSSNTNENYTYFRKKFSTDNQVERAIVYVSATHDFELYLNGELVGKGPGYHYPQYQYYKAFDVTTLISAEVDHLFASRTHWYGGGQGRPSSENGFILKAVIEYSDGTQKVVVTDETWKQSQVYSFLTGQPHRQSGEGVGFVDRIDSRYFVDNWNQFNGDDSDWNQAHVIGSHPTSPWNGVMQPNLARLIEEELLPVSVNMVSSDTYVIDFGKVHAGIPKIEFTGGNNGQEVRMVGGYTLKGDGRVNTENNQRTDLSYNFIHNGSQATFQPMVYMGMRYLEVKGSPNELTVDNVKFIARHYELEDDRSSFISSNDMLNQVWGLMKHSLAVGAQESFVDTPTREKGGFLGDSWTIGVASMATMGERVMNLRIMEEFLNSQDQFWDDGRLNAVYPNGDGGRDIPDYTQMFLIWVWDYYTFTGNKQFLIDNFDRLQKVAKYVDNHIDPTTGLVKNLSGGGGPYLYGIIDWPSTMRYGYDMSSNMRTVMNAYAYADFDILSKIADVIGQSDISNEYRAKAVVVKDAMTRLLINNDSVYVDGLYSSGQVSNHVSQHANALPLAMDIVPNENIDPVFAKIKSRKMNMGMVTLRWLPEAIGKAGDGAHLLDLYTNTEWDGWAKCIAKGATTTWESWDALDIHESLSHPWGAAGLLGMQRYILGVQPLEPQFAKIQIKPLDFEGKLANVEGVVPTDRGDVSVSWDREEATYHMTIELPDNITAAVYLPQVGGDLIVSEVLANGEQIEAEIVGSYLFVGNFSSGTHQFAMTYEEKQAPLEVQELPGSIEKKLTIYPNPAESKAVVNLGAYFSEVSIQVHNLNGIKVFERIFHDTSQCEIELNDSWTEGTYVVTIIESGTKKMGAKMIKN